MTDKFEQPRVFISSTIEEFRDLRSALRYWFEELGFAVQLSEYSDFEHRPDAGVLDACFENVRRSDFFVLLIGGDRGSWFDEGGCISVTQQEYRTAIQAEHSPQIVPFVRESRNYQDEAWTNAFISEVRSGAPQRGEMWTIPFNNFRDMVDGIRSTIPATRDSLAKQAILLNVRQELEYNLRCMLTKTGRADPFYPTYLIDEVRSAIKLTRNDFEGRRELTHHQMKLVVMYTQGGIPAGENLIESAINYAILSGALLQFDRESGAYRPSELLGELHALKSEMSSFRGRVRILNDDGWLRRLLDAWYRVKDDENGTTTMSGSDLVFLYGIHDSQINIERITLGLLQRLYGHEVDDFERRPSSPVEDEQARIDGERVSEQELRLWLERNDVLLRLKHDRATPEQRTATRQLGDALKDALGMSDEEFVAFLRAPTGTALSDDQVRRLQTWLLDGEQSPPSGGDAP